MCTVVICCNYVISFFLIFFCCLLLWFNSFSCVLLHSSMILSNVMWWVSDPPVWVQQRKALQITLPESELWYPQVESRRNSGELPELNFPGFPKFLHRRVNAEGLHFELLCMHRNVSIFSFVTFNRQLWREGKLTTQFVRRPNDLISLHITYYS